MSSTPQIQTDETEIECAAWQLSCVSCVLCAVHCVLAVRIPEECSGRQLAMRGSFDVQNEATYPTECRHCGVGEDRLSEREIRPESCAARFFL